jgi:hypothetical protein
MVVPATCIGAQARRVDVAGRGCALELARADAWLAAHR